MNTIISPDASTYIGPEPESSAVPPVYPLWVYNPTAAPVIVLNANQLAALLALNTGWTLTPQPPYNPPTIPPFVQPNFLGSFTSFAVLIAEYPIGNIVAGTNPVAYTLDEGLCLWNGNQWIEVGTDTAVMLTSSDGSIAITGNGTVFNLTVASSPSAFFAGNFPSVVGLPSATANANKLACVIGVGYYQSVNGVWQALVSPTNATLGISTATFQSAATGVAFTVPLTATNNVGTMTWVIVTSFGAVTSPAVSDSNLTIANPIGTTIVLVQGTDSTTNAIVQKMLIVTAAGAGTAAATPTFSPAAGTYPVAQSVTISCSTPSPTIYYTTNGTTPDTSSTVYSGPVTVSASQTLQAIATASGYVQSAVGSAAYRIQTVQNPIAVNVPSCGGTNAGSNYFEGLPIFKNRVRESSGFGLAATGSSPVALSNAGWPAADFQCELWSFAGGFAVPSWTSGTFTCGFIGTGNETVAAINSCTVDTIVHGTAGAYTTFNLHSVTGNFGFKVTATTYAISGISQASSAVVTVSTVSGSNPFSIGCPITFSGITVGMIQIDGASGTVTGIGGSSGAWTVTTNINSSTFSAWSAGGTVGGVIDVFAGLPEYPMTTIDTVTSPSAFTNEAIAYYSQFAATRNMEGSGVLTNVSVNSATTRATPINKQACFYKLSALEGQPAEWNASLAMACGVGMWLNMPAVQDSGFSWAQSLASWLFANVPAGVPIWLEIADELWNLGFANYNISGVTQASPAVVTIASLNPTNPFAVNNTVIFANVGGMTQLNGQTATVTAVGGTVGAWTITLNVNSSAYSAFTSGGAVTNAAATTGTEAFYNAYAASGYASMPAFYAYCMHTIAGIFRTTFGGRYGTDVRLVEAWQTTGNGVYFHHNVYAYYQTQAGWSMAADIYCLAGAPYMNLPKSQSITASLSASGVLTVTNGSGVKPGATIAGNGVGNGIVVSAQLSTAQTTLPLPWGLGTYQTNYSGAGVVSQPITSSFNLSSTVAQIESALSAIAVNQPFQSMMESINAQSLTYCGNALVLYECGWGVDTEPSGLTHGGAAIMDTSNPGMTGVMNTYSQAMINSGAAMQNIFQGGIDSNDNPATVALAPIDWMSTTYPIVAATCPRLASAASFVLGASPTRNLVVRGTPISGANWADNPAFNNVLGTLADNGFQTSQAPFYGVGGYRSYILNCPSAGTYTLTASVTTTGNGTSTNLIVNGATVSSDIALPNSTTGNVSLGSVTLQFGANCIVFGKGSAQSGVTINSITPS